MQVKPWTPSFFPKRCPKSSIDQPKTYSDIVQDNGEKWKAFLAIFAELTEMIVFSDFTACIFRKFPTKLVLKGFLWQEFVLYRGKNAWWDLVSYGAELRRKVAVLVCTSLRSISASLSPICNASALLPQMGTLSAFGWVLRCWRPTKSKKSWGRRLF